VEWLGHIPVHRRVRKIKNTTHLKGRVGWKGLTSEEYLEEGFAYLVTGTDFSSKFILWHDCHCVDQSRYDDDPFIQLENGDLLITKDGTIGKLALVCDLDKPACLNSGIFLIRPTNSYITSFLFWLLSSEPFRVFCDLLSVGSTIQHLYQNVFERFIFPVPSIFEQENIVHFLDRETGKIDELVAEQRRLIELLKEQRQAVISHGVTKGLNPDTPMKPSGIEWLGDVPAHWRNLPLKSISSHNDDVLDENTDPDYEIGYVDIGSVDGVNGISTIETFLFSSAPSRARRRVRYGDVIISTVRTYLRAIARISNPEENLIVSTGFVVIRSGFDLDPVFAGYSLSSNHFIEKVIARSTGESYPAINAKDLVSIHVALPPLEEQILITRFLDRETGRIDELMAEAECAISLLQKRRAALFSAAANGQIDVRSLGERGVA
jgi:type I restriction enzyme, S subunit